MSARSRQLVLIAAVTVLSLSLWFSASAVVPALREAWGISNAGASLLTVAVQLGFVTGALLSAVLNLPDRVPPPALMAGAATVGAVATLAVALLADGLAAATPLRFLTGFALAGVYPVGMRLMATWFDRDRGFALGVLVGALTLGSTLPQLLRGVSALPWRGVLITAAVCALIAAALAATSLRVGPHATPSPPFTPGYVITMARDRAQRLVTIGYLGHMWELYAVWTWLPAYVAASYAAWRAGADTRLAVGVTAFAGLGVAGAAACLVAGRVADRRGRAETTIVAMTVSGACCVLAAAVFGAHPALVVALVVVWGAAVIADSAQFSAALTEVADRRYVGTALTAQTAAGFLLTVVTIQALPLLVDAVGWRAAVPLLALGPAAGVAAMAAAAPALSPSRRAPDAPGSPPATR